MTSLESQQLRGVVNRWHHAHMWNRGIVAIALEAARRSVGRCAGRQTGVLLNRGDVGNTLQADGQELFISQIGQKCRRQIL